jgi:hypothetical protein
MSGAGRQAGRQPAVIGFTDVQRKEERTKQGHCRHLKRD